ncbi:hypothetical protein KY290_020995 [Solanum tuberosum]|uniref:CRAL-TRIO domain-containing protein n=1 Tax=Solanum tuberosum TaxID=4113 RepID=A0ABQ7V089_SOLTU|nr:hypothetical protein KY289_020181 [Solanum tuberosum]KAH0692846.1 hypothetical protein KY285_019943 [Solanum tuberosum]KAH0757502.1 hypothetical protein KY290_020995 [Solanum tuberosum]
MGSSSTSSKDDFSVLVLASDLGIDARPFLTHQEPEDSWYDCTSDPPPSEEQDFAHLDSLQFLRLESGSDKLGNRIFRIVGKYFPALVISAERLKKYVFNKICTELPEGPFCIVYMHSTVQKEDNNPGLTILRWIYEELPTDHKDRLQAVYFVHPGLRSRLVLATLGRFFLSGGLYWKVKYVSRLQYLWDDIKKVELEIPEFVQKHDEILEHRPLTDYGIEPDPLHLSQMPPSAYSIGRHDTGWASRQYMS